MAISAASRGPGGSAGRRCGTSGRISSSCSSTTCSGCRSPRGPLFGVGTALEPDGGERRDDVSWVLVIANGFASGGSRSEQAAQALAEPPLLQAAERVGILARQVSLLAQQLFRRPRPPLWDWPPEPSGARPVRDARACRGDAGAGRLPGWSVFCDLSFLLTWSGAASWIPDCEAPRQGSRLTHLTYRNEASQIHESQCSGFHPVPFWTPRAPAACKAVFRASSRGP